MLSSKYKQTEKIPSTKMAIASKEARETRYRLKLLDQSHLTNIDVKKYLHEIEEIIKMLTKIVKTTSENIKNPST